MGLLHDLGLARRPDRTGQGNVLHHPYLFRLHGPVRISARPSALRRLPVSRGVRLGGEWGAGFSLLHESVPEAVRVRYAGWLHTATPTGQILAALASLLYPILGWRGLFLLGILPALLTIYLRRSIPEPEKWQQRKQADRPSTRDLFRSPLARSTWPAALMLSCAIFGLWSTSFWAPTFVVTKVVAEGGVREAAQRLASFAGLAGAVGTMAACLLAPWIVGRFGSRRATGSFFFSGALLVAVFTYGYA